MSESGIKKNNGASPKLRLFATFKDLKAEKKWLKRKKQIEIIRGLCSIPAKIVRLQFAKLNMHNILYVLKSFDKTNVPMMEPDKYIIASLYSSYNTSYNETV